ncbi:hypothetical protein [Mucilaginibacter paludis]|uniref:Uncharacterized protein n=1 Tax=Mucilaginibacter paludis DSM 18603 TaxID=714943 RepID=H1Y3I8_9SPHI|nr:hypothetical protein [Mucilaginibacter paludis]EHQ29756.1 hypothetical protein Mucpa_5687 [Mucilaginibacter paludis DSM 18603]
MEAVDMTVKTTGFDSKMIEEWKNRKRWLAYESRMKNDDEPMQIDR